MKNNYIAIAKALGIMLMVVGHSGCPDYLYRFIYMFHMPLFFFCSGFFMKPAEKFVDVRKFVFRRFKGLYWPYVKWGLLFLLFHNLFLSWKLYDPDYINYYSRSDFIDRFLHIVFTMTGHDQLADPFWFFKQLLLSSILVFVVEYALRSFR
jgi:fucose 4-O-acetylase-like acetyltransferase